MTLLDEAAQSASKSTTKLLWEAMWFWKKPIYYINFKIININWKYFMYGRGDYGRVDQWDIDSL
jgi:hypothetical protein